MNVRPLSKFQKKKIKPRSSDKDSALPQWRHCPFSTHPKTQKSRPKEASSLTPLSGGGNKVSDKVGSKAIRQQSFYSISGASDLGIS